MKHPPALELASFSTRRRALSWRRPNVQRCGGPPPYAHTRVKTSRPMRQTTPMVRPEKPLTRRYWAPF